MPAEETPLTPDVNPIPTTAPPPNVANSVWTYRGYQLGSDNFMTAIVHYYRAEVTRANAWRGRLDITTNWAVVATAAAISFAFGEPTTHHSVIILITLLVTLFLVIEARRYRYYELWSFRLRLIETDFFAAMLAPPFQPSPDWSDKLSRSLLHPYFPISAWEAFGRRLRRNYIWIYLILTIAWVSKLLLYPEAITSWRQLLQRSRMGAVSGEVVLALGLIFYVTMIVIGIRTLGLRQATGEVLSGIEVQELPTAEG